MQKPADHAAILGRYSNTCIIGAGVIGASWAALFLAHGLKVVVNDPQPDIENVVRTMLTKAGLTLKELGLPHEGLEKNLRFEPDLERAMAGIDLVQENGPENPEWKQKLWARVEPLVPKHALLLSSSSARPATEQAKLMKDGSRMLVGHPFNPPHLIPLVEVVPGEPTAPEAIADAVAFYEALGKVPRVLKKEIQGFVANRLQRAIMRESCYLVQEGVVTVDELDDIVTSSIGLRWAVNGPFSSFHMGGGPKGLESFFQHLGKNMANSFKVIPQVELDEKLQQRIIDQAAASFGKTPIPQMERMRDDSQLAILHALAAISTRNEGQA
ncbi:MAG: hydroxylacyl-CoA dehydrogenase [Candidatus Afipia apatlaquensis]|uniref:Hydroxylacyl-CoA dehydrogenase n=1 Tax=Candidatus Afipia apatlaquensis TaxID=2712852 RepID=A0A7C9VQF9_9BRAD|nr:hydroxylacyl-CoA dehydrogenase [Candidatus Afipia apatlaquensis]